MTAKPNIALDGNSLRQNLLDAGCSADLIQKCMQLAQEGRYIEFKRLLACQRRALLDNIHRDEKRIDCLDYLVFKLEKEN